MPPKIIKFVKESQSPEAAPLPGSAAVVDIIKPNTKKPLLKKIKEKNEMKSQNIDENKIESDEQEEQVFFKDVNFT